MSVDRIFVSILSGVLALAGLTMASRAADDGVYLAGFLFFLFGIFLVFRMIAAAFDNQAPAPR